MSQAIKKVTKPQKRVSFLSDIKRNNFSYMIALPAIIYMFIFSYMAYPYLLLAFQRYDYRNNTIKDIIFHGNWVGLDNFKFFFSSQNVFRVTYNTLFLNILFIITGTVMSVLLALLLNELRCKWFIKSTQSIMLFPNYISWIMVSYILLSLFSTEYGIANQMLTALGKNPVNWYAEPKIWPAILVIMRIWKGAGMNAIIYLAAITGMDSSLDRKSVV